MASFGGNFGDGKSSCPLCLEHLDSQTLGFHCKAKDVMEIKCTMKDIYSDKITFETAKAAQEMMKIRERILKDGK